MKALVLYRSHYGNTRRVAEAIAERLAAKGHAVVVQDVRRRLPGLTDVDVTFNGAPTRMKRAGFRSMGVLRKLKRRGFGRLLAILEGIGFERCEHRTFEFGLNNLLVARKSSRRADMQEVMCDPV